MEIKSLLIKDTTEDERRRIVEESLGNIEAGCDGCSAGILEMYEPYIKGEMELREVTMSFNRGYISGKELPVRGECGYM